MLDLGLEEPSDDDLGDRSDSYDDEDDYEKKWLRVQHDFDKLSTNYRRLQSVNEALKRQIGELNRQGAEYLNAKADAERSAHEAELRMDKMQKNAMIDQRAREGQVKRVRIMEHQMKEVLEESKKEQRQRVKSEERTAELVKALNRERAQRLHDLHQNFRIAGSSAAAADREKAMEARYFGAEREIATLSREQDVLTAACKAHARINDLGVGAQMRQERALEHAQAERIMLQSALQDAVADARAARATSASLRTEILALRTDLVRASKGQLRLEDGSLALADPSASSACGGKLSTVRFSLPLLQSGSAATLGDASTVKDGSVAERPPSSAAGAPKKRRNLVRARTVVVDPHDKAEISRTGTVVSKEGLILSTQVGGDLQSDLTRVLGVEPNARRTLTAPDPEDGDG